jgi:5-methylthioadenosine/S-adenosylhomocysteine deaminase
MTSILIEHVDYLITVNEHNEILRNVSVLIVDGVITEIGADIQTSTDVERIDGKRKLLMPGLVNLHTHTPMGLLRGVSEDVDLQDFLKIVWAAEGAVMDPDTVMLGSTHAAVESLLSGTTTQLDMYFHHESAHRGARNVGIRHVGGPTFLDFPGPDNKTWEERLTEADRWEKVKKEIGGPAIPSVMCPHGTYTVSESHLSDLVAITKSWTNPMMTVHVSENAAENEDVLSRLGKTPTRILEDAGALKGDFPIVFGHGVHLTDDDFSLAAKPHITIAHCPGSNLKLASGALRYQTYRDAGIQLGIGTDGCSTSNDLDIFTAMRLSAMLAKLTSASVQTAPSVDIIRAATINGAKALGMGEDIGSIEIGKRADVILIDLDKPHLAPIYDINALVVYSVGKGDVSDVIVDGELLVKNGEMVKFDTEKLLDDVEAAAKRVRKALS